MENIQKQLQKILVGRVLILGVGNRMRGDDSAGSLLIDKIQNCKNFVCLDCGIVPENYLEKVVTADPDILLIVDAINFCGSQGEIRVFNPNDIDSGGLSTHSLSLRMVCDYLKSRMDVRIYLLGIQPKDTGFHDGLSETVNASVESLATTLCELSMHFPNNSLKTKELVRDV